MMLVLNRYIGQSIIIDGNIKIKILGSSGVIRVGIDAPKHINIVREELIGDPRHHPRQFKDRPHYKEI